jgi:hypothetical protein
MSEFMDVVNAFGTPLKVAWVGWAAWGVGQYFWFRHERSTPMVKKVTTVANTVAKKPAVPKPIAAQAADAPVVGRLITPTHVASEAKAPVPVAPRPQPEAQPVATRPVSTLPVSSMPVAAAPADAPVPLFDPSKAVIEQFGVVSDEGVLDKFVRDFEMQDARPRRRRPARPAETPSYGAEAPPTP